MKEPPAPAKPPRRARRTRPWLKPLIALSLIAALVFLSVILVVAYEFFYRDRIVLGVRVQGESMSGLGRAEANQFFQNKFGNPDAILARSGGAPIIVRDTDPLGGGNREWRAWPWELGLRTDFAPIAQQAILLGHRDNWWSSLAEQARCLALGCELGIDVQFDEHTAQAYLGWLAPQVNQPARDASVRIEGIRVVATPAQKGRELDGPAMQERMRRHILTGERDDLVLTFRETAPLIADASATKNKIDALLASPLLLTFGGRTWAIDQPALASMISIQRQSDGVALKLGASIDRAQLLAQARMIANDVNQPARDARFRFEPTTGALTTLITSQAGQTLDPDAIAKQIEQQWLANGAKSMALPVVVTKPTIAMEDAAKFGIKELVAQGVSNFRGSSAGRLQNIRTATAQFEGIVVPPGGTFSFDQFLGEVDEANGYDDAYIIFADRTVLGPGGGVCQVSSTVFRAAFFGGFPIAERWAHAYRVGFYEPPVGLDATVFSPSVDFKFRNDTDAYLLIQPKLDPRAFTLTFNFYGTKPNRTVEMEDPIVENIVKHGPAIYTDDPTLNKGITKQIDFEHDGSDVTIWRKILVNGQLVKREKFFSRYEPWVARYLVGTKVAAK